MCAVSPATFGGFFLFLSYILFKFAAFPFHSWAPQVYEKLSISSLYIFAVIAKFFFGSLLLNLLLGFKALNI